MDIKKNPKSGLAGRMMTVVVVAVVFLLMTLAGVLLVSNYRAQVELRRSSLEYFHQKAIKEALQVSQFLNGVGVVLTRLSHSRELEGYYQNQALGMSMDYGLKASLLLVESEFREIMVDGDGHLSAVAFVSRDGTSLVNVGVDGVNDADILAKVKALPVDGVRYVIDKKIVPPRIFITVPYVFKGVFIGRIVGLVSNRSLSENAALRENDGAGGEVGCVFACFA
jgi:hypothetical protein